MDDEKVCCPHYIKWTRGSASDFCAIINLPCPPGAECPAVKILKAAATMDRSTHEQVEAVNQASV